MRAKLLLAGALLAACVVAWQCKRRSPAAQDRVDENPPAIFGPLASVPFDPETVLFEGRPVSALFVTLRKGTADERSRAVHALGHVHHGCEQHWMHSGMCVPDAEARRVILRAAEAGHIGVRARVIVPYLIEALKDPDAGVRASAASELGEEMCGEALSACPALRECLNDPDSRARLCAASALYLIRFETEGGIEASVAVLSEDPSPDARSKAACTLRWMGKDARSAIPALEKALADPDDGVRSYAQQALDSMR